MSTLTPRPLIKRISLTSLKVTEKRENTKRKNEERTNSSNNSNFSRETSLDSLEECRNEGVLKLLIRGSSEISSLKSEI